MSRRSRDEPFDGQVVPDVGTRDGLIDQAVGRSRRDGGAHPRQPGGTGGSPPAGLACGITPGKLRNPCVALGNRSDGRSSGFAGALRNGGHERLDVLGGVGAGKQRRPAQHANERQVASPKATAAIMLRLPGTVMFRPASRNVRDQRL